MKKNNWAPARRPCSPKKRVSDKAEIQRMHLRASRTLWLLGALSRPKTPGRNGIVPQADRPAHQERVIKVDCFLKIGRIFTWYNPFRAQIRLRMHLRASRTLWLLGALSGPKTPGHNGIAPQARSPAHQKGKKMVNCFLKTMNFHLESLIWASDKADNAPQSIRTLWLLGAALAAADGPMCANLIQTWTP